MPALALIRAGQPATAVRPSAEPVAIRLDIAMEPVFDKLDENRSGYLEQPESPFVTMALIEPADPAAP